MAGDPHEDVLSRLARAYKHGDEQAFSELAELARERLYRLAYRMLGHSDQALDVVQEALMKAYTGIDAWTERAAFFSWIYRVTTNLAIDRMRQRKRQRNLHDGLRERTQVPESDLSKFVEAQATEHYLAQLRQAVDALPPRQKAMVVLRHYEGLQLRDIAEIQACAVGTVKSTLHQAFSSLRQTLDPMVREVREHG